MARRLICQPLHASMIAVALVASRACPAVGEPPPPTRPETWAATDALGRRIEPGAYPQPRSDRFVGIFYFLWLEGGKDAHVYDISKLIAADPRSPAWGPEHAFHWWGEPYFGYYRSDDEWVIARHAQLLGDAGVDVVFFDVTNALTYDATLKTVCDVFTRLRASGRRTPQVAFLTHSKSAKVVTHLYDTFYKPGLYQDLWFRWRGKPLMLAPSDGIAPAVARFFTLRESWAWSDPKGWFGDGRGKWPWLDNTPQKYGWIDAKDKPEEVAVAVSQHPVTPIGRSFAAGKQPPADQLQSAAGAYFAEQWTRALKVDPEFVFVTGWNEWIAQRTLSDGKTGPRQLGYATLKAGDSYFVDTYDEEFSRDIEPMTGGHGDDCYYQLVDGIRRFKGAAATPPATRPTTIDIDAGFAQWATVEPRYDDDAGDTAPREAHGYDPAQRLTNRSGRNDLVECRVAYDRDNVYFYARANDDLTAPAAKNWMTLLIDERPGGRGGWNGYTLAINRTAPHDGRASIERYASGAHGWVSAGEARVAFKGAEIQFAVPRALIAGGAPRFDFKWIDNVALEGDAIRLIDQGDAAPNGRFDYQFRIAR